MYNSLSILLVLFSLNLNVDFSSLKGDISAFIGAEGSGKFTTGGREGKIIIVNSLADSGPGSLRDALKVKEARTIVFEVSGNIELESSLEIKYGDVTIAGHTAPGDGICLKNYPLKIKASNVILRYIRVRLGDQKSVQGDALSVNRQKNIIIDHCSFSWGTDEVVSSYDNENFTMQWCIISEGLNMSVHEKGEHGYGGIWGGMNATFHHNILVHHKSRNPRFCGARYHKQPERERVDFVNNVVYNWQSNSAYGGEKGNHNIVNNYYKTGPATNKSSQKTLLNPSIPYGEFYMSGNIMHANDEVTRNNALGLKGDFSANQLMQEPVELSIPFKAQKATVAYESTLKESGASFRRDALDQRLIEEIKKGKAAFGKLANGIIDSQEEVGGWPVLNQIQSREDLDLDGMEDKWERKMGLNPNDPNDHSGYLLNKEYTNIEVFMEDLLTGKN